LVKVVVYNNRGQEIRTLVSAYQAPNHYIVVWDGKDNRGQSMPSGSYLIRLIAKDHDSMSRTTLLK
jgi:flagellar hook assembly protein FlgD